jgi:threonine/homoserine/homoserine lactone efflux protein
MSLSFVSDLVTSGRIWIHIVGGVFLLLVGAFLFFKKPNERSKEVSHTSLIGDFFSTLFLTLANPLTIIAFLAIFAALSISQYEGSTPLLILGVFIGASLWWLILSESLTFFRKNISKKVMTSINRLAGAIFFCFGIAALAMI